MNICMCLYSRQFIKSKYLLKVKYFKVNDVKYKLNFKMMITKMVEGGGSFFFLEGEGERPQRGFAFRAYKLFRSESKKKYTILQNFYFSVSVHIDHNENIAHFLDIWIRIFKFYNVELLGEGPDSSPSVELCIVFFSDIIYIHVIQLFEI